MGIKARSCEMLLLLGMTTTTEAFVTLRPGRSPWTTRIHAGSSTFADGTPYSLSCTPQEKLAEIEEPAAREMLKTMRSWDVPVPSAMASAAKVRATGVGPRARVNREADSPPVVLLHGFDSSCLEYRRLHPLLDDRHDTFALDILGWGFSQLDGITSFSAEAKREYLYGFWKDVLQRRPMVLVGASLGGAAAVDFAATYPEAVQKLVLIDGQVYIDGVGQMSSFPVPIAKLGIKVLKSEPLRAYAGKLSYNDPKTYSTRDAMNIGRLHCLREGWEDASVKYMLSGGYSTSSKVSKIRAPTLVLWGKQDQILETSKYAGKFLEDLTEAELKLIDDCGHVPHLEKPRETADAILAFIEGRQVGAKSSEAAFAAGGGVRPQQPAQGLWASITKQFVRGEPTPCVDCQGENVVPCPNCEGQGSYMTYGRPVQCKCCGSTGLVICRACFAGDPLDIAGIRNTVQEAALLRRKR